MDLKPNAHVNSMIDDLLLELSCTATLLNLLLFHLHYSGPTKVDPSKLEIHKNISDDHNQLSVQIM